MENQCLFSQRSTISAAEVFKKCLEQARGHLPLVPSSAGLPKGGVSGREGVTWRWDPACPEGSNLPGKSLQLLPTHPVRALPLVSPQLTRVKGELSSAFLPQLSIPTPSSAPSYGVCHGQAGRSGIASHFAGACEDSNRLSRGEDTVLGMKGWVSVEQGMGFAGTDGVGSLRSWEIQERRECCWREGRMLKPGLSGQGPSPSCAGG